MPSEVCIALVAGLHLLLAALADWQSAAICLVASMAFALLAWTFGALSTRSQARPMQLAPVQAVQR